MTLYFLKQRVENKLNGIKQITTVRFSANSPTRAVVNYGKWEAVYTHNVSVSSSARLL